MAYEPEQPVMGVSFDNDTYWKGWLLRLWRAMQNSRAYISISPTFAASYTLDLSQYAGYAVIVINLTLTANLTFNVTNGVDGQVIRLWLTQDGTGGRTFTGGANINFSTDVPSPALTATANKIDSLGFQWRSVNSKAHLLAVVKGFS